LLAAHDWQLLLGWEADADSVAFFRAYRDETQLTVARFLHSHDKRA